MRIDSLIRVVLFDTIQIHNTSIPQPRRMYKRLGSSLRLCLQSGMHVPSREAAVGNLKRLN